MLIPVIYPNGTHDLVKDFYLDYLISTEKIDKFKRSSGWVSIDAADIRGKKSHIRYSGPERRRQQELSTDSQSTQQAPIEFFKPGEE